MSTLERRKQALSGGAFRRLAGIMNRAVASVSYRVHVAMANSWRDQYNPLRHLTIRRAVSLLEAGERGELADLQWTYRFIEMQDATLGALVDRRTSAIQKLDWNIKLRDKIPAGKEKVAELQAAALRAAYERITNLTKALEALAMASFRGFAHLEKIRDAQGRITQLACVDQWFWVRKGLYGSWKINQDARFGTIDGEDVDLARFVIREVSRPINRVALVCFVRKGLSQKDWDGFIEVFGIPAVFIIAPPNLPKDREEEYLEAAEQVAGDAKGVLPGGSDVKTVDNGARGQNPFKEHIDYQDSQVVLRGTGGKLTMLSDPTGIGGGSTDAHEATFDAIAQAEAMEISEVLREQLDAEILAGVTPGEPAYAYFELAANEETNTSEIVEDVATLEGAGLEVSEEWIEEKTGYPVKRKAAPVPTSGAPATVPGKPILNREDASDSEWQPFARETGTLGIPREIMPQIQQGNRAAVVQFFRKRGIRYTRELVKPADLKPSQAEFSQAKVDTARARKSGGEPRSILISSDNHVLDGHHQYVGALQDAPNRPIEVFRLHVPAMWAIGMLLAMPSTTTAEMPPVRNREDGKEALADALGVTSDMLEPIADLIDTLAGDVAGDRAGDADWLAALEEAALRIPELIDSERAEELAADLEAAMGGEALRGARDGLRAGTQPTKQDQ